MVLQGEFHPDFGQVAEALIKIIPRRTPGGASVCIYHEGEKVVDVWGGTKDQQGHPWKQDTIVFSASTTKGVTSTLLHILVDRGLANYDDTIAKHWPAFGQNGKKNITIRQALSHQAGLYNIADYGFSKEHFWNWDSALRLLEEAKPSHAPGEKSAYHALTYGHIIGGLIEKITGKPFQQVMKEELSDPLQLEGMFIGVPNEELHRLANLITRDGYLGSAIRAYKDMNPYIRQVLHFLTRLIGMDFSYFRKALAPDFVEEINFNSQESMQAIIPAANGAFTARSLAKMYAALANGGEFGGVRLMSEDRVRIMSQQQTNGRDRVVNFPMKWRLGYHEVFTLGQKAPHAFGHFGFGGSGAWCDPSRKLSMAMTLNTGVGTPFGDLRIVKLSTAVMRCADRRQTWREQKPIALADLQTAN
ncbi:Esterase A [gamma proteobacterium HdN1]|nr:Esterase A [gamma proteobacterium HdN1]